MGAEETTSIVLSSVGAVSDQAAKYLPEPSVSGAGLFKDVLEVASSVGGAVVGGVPNASLGDFGELISLQIEVQKELQSASMVSNVERSRHESKMAPIRNIRVS